jgi:hypothetical protein
MKTKKHMKTTVILLYSSLLLIAGQTFAQQQMNQQITMKLDETGNAQINIQQKMNASQWQNWISYLGNNPAAIKREIQKGMPAFFLEDFKFDKNEMERSYELSLKALGVCKVDKKGRRILETDEKDINLTKLTDLKYMYVNSPMEFAGQVQQTHIIEFPKSAYDIELDKDAYGKTIFAFRINDPSGSLGYLRYIGFTFLLSGIFSLVFFKVRGH